MAQSMAAITSLVSPLPSALEDLQVDQVRARRHARIAGVGRAGDDPRDVRAVTILVASEAVPAREVHRRDDPITQGRMIGNARIDDRDADALARQSLEPGQGAAPHLVRADRLGGDRHQPAHRHVTGQVRHGRVLRHRVERVPRDFQHRGAAEALGDARAVPAGNLGHVGLAAGDDHADGVGAPGGNPLGQIARELCAMAGFRAGGARHGHSQRDHAPRLQSKQTKDDSES